MVGPKLDARSYTILLLVVIASLLSLNLFAQITSDRANIGGRTGLTNQQDNYSEAASTAEIASATREVAAANREIANAIRELAGAVGKVQINAGSTSTNLTRSTTTPPSPGGRLEIRQRDVSGDTSTTGNTPEIEVEGEEAEPQPVYEGSIRLN